MATKTKFMLILCTLGIVLAASGHREAIHTIVGVCALIFIVGIFVVSALANFIAGLRGTCEVRAKAAVSKPPRRVESERRTKRRLWTAAGLFAAALYATFIWPIPAIMGLRSEPPITPQERARLDLMDHPRIISKEVVTNFHRIGDGVLLRTDSGAFEFVTHDDCNIMSPEDARRIKDAGFDADALLDEQAKQPIYLINKDFGDGPEWALQQAFPGEKNIDDSPYTNECSVTPNN